MDVHMRLHQFRKLDWRAGRRLGKRDRVVRWSKGPLQGKLWTRAQWEELPDHLDVRVVEIRVEVAGFRTQTLVLVTTLLDAAQCSAAELGRLYFRRWAVELFFRDIKQTPGMGVLRCQTPGMVDKEIVMHALAYNLIRALMQDIAQSHDLPAGRLSFKGTVDALRQWQGLFEGSQDHPRRVRQLRQMFHETVAGDPLLVRPDRSEPRAVKRRPKNFRLLTKPRAQMVVERCRKQSQKPSNKALNQAPFRTDHKTNPPDPDHARFSDLSSSRKCQRIVQ